MTQSMISSLTQLCVDTICHENISYSKTKIPHELHVLIEKKCVEKECSNVVTCIKEIETNRVENEWVGYEEGIQSVIQRKIYHYNNGKKCEKSMKRGIYNYGLFGSPLVLYYLSQEPDFRSWFKHRPISHTIRQSMIDALSEAVTMGETVLMSEN